MPQFHLDTSGQVRPEPDTDAGLFVAAAFVWSDLDPFTQGYIEALFFTSEESLCEESNGARHVPSVAFDTATMASRFVGGDSFGFADLAPETLADIIADCQAFQRDNVDTLALAYARDYDAAQAGRDFWFTRCGHGVGFWDRDALESDSAEYEALTRVMIDARDDRAAWGEALAKRKALKAESIGERLSEAAREAGNVDAYLGDDSRVYLS